MDATRSYLLRKLTVFAILMMSLLAISGCGGGGVGGGPSIPNIDTPLSPSQLGLGGTTTTTTPPATTTLNSSNLSPTAPPAMPTAPPPRVQAPRFGPVRQGPTTVQLHLPAGYSVISFPLASLTSVSGLQYQLYSWGATGFATVDPVAHPDQVNTAFAYFAYADTASTITVSGDDNSSGALNSVNLSAGWNMIGCPTANNLPWSDITFTRASVTRTIEEASSTSSDPSQYWFSQYDYNFADGSFEDLQQAGATLHSQQGRWVFAWQDLTLNFNVVPPSPLPQITSLSASSVKEGDSLTVTGTGFGPQNHGMLNIGGTLVPPGDITSWSSTSIVATVPVGAPSGNVVVYVSLYPSNREPLTVTSAGGGGGSSTGSLSGEVYNVATDAPLAGAQILLDTGASTSSAADGTWSLTNLAPGQHLIYVTLIGYQTAISDVTVTAGSNQTVGVALSAGYNGGGGGTGGGGGGVQTGTLNVAAFAYEPSDGPRVPVQEIDVHEYGNFNNKWSTGSITDVGNNEFDLACDGAVFGTTYVVEVTWADGTTWTTYPVFYQDGQTESVYYP